MITVDTKQLVSAIEEAGVFHLPDMNGGTSYLYNELYRKLSEGADLRLSEIDFSRFALDDIESLRGIHSEMESDADKAQTLAHTLWKIPSVAVASAFV